MNAAVVVQCLGLGPAQCHDETGLEYNDLSR